MEDLSGKVAVVTGGGSGIGEALVQAFVAEGMQVAVADIERDAAERVAEEARGTGVNALAVPADVADARSVPALAAAIVGEAAGLRLAVAVVIGNAVAQRRRERDSGFRVRVDVVRHAVEIGETEYEQNVDCVRGA